MWREYYDTFWIRGGAFGARSVIGIRLASRPSRDGVLQLVEHLDIHVVGRAVERHQFAKAPVGVILVGEFQNRFAGLAAQPHYGAADLLVGPFARCHFPGVGNTCQVVGCRKVECHACMVVELQERCGNRIRYGAFDGFICHL